MREHVTFGGEESPCTDWLYEPDAGIRLTRQAGQEVRRSRRAAAVAARRVALA